MEATVYLNRLGRHNEGSFNADEVSLTGSETNTSSVPRTVLPARVLISAEVIQVVVCRILTPCSDGMGYRRSVRTKQLSHPQKTAT